MSIKILLADLDNPVHAEHVLFLTNSYAKDEMGKGGPLAEEVQENLISGIKEMPTSLVFLAYDREKPMGIANCFIGFSTFYAKKLINIHDIAVLPEGRGKGIGKSLIEAVYTKAKEMNCCKVTLEVLENNPARRLYERSGFEYGEPLYYFMTRKVD